MIWTLITSWRVPNSKSSPQASASPVGAISVHADTVQLARMCSPTSMMRIFSQHMARRDRGGFPLPNPAPSKLREIEIPTGASVLVVEDSIARRHFFLSCHRIPQAFLADNPDRAIDLVSNFGPFDFVLLDWDLSLGVTSEPVARFLAEMKYSGQIFVHTENPFGQQVLGRILPAAAVIPFGQFEIRRCV